MSLLFVLKRAENLLLREGYCHTNMADGRAVALRVLIVCLLTLFVKKPTFITFKPVRSSWSYYDIDSLTFVENSYIYIYISINIMAI